MAFTATFPSRQRPPPTSTMTVSTSTSSLTSPSNSTSTPLTSSASALPACFSYALASTGVTIMNKVVFSHAHFHFPWSTLAFQNVVSVLVISLARAFRLTRAGRFSLPLARRMPVPICCFVLFIFTNAQSLRYVNLPVLTVWKSLGPMFVTLFERVHFGDHFSPSVYAAMALIVLSAFVTAINDLEYSPVGYFWAACNVLANVAYLASLRIYLRAPDLHPLDKTFHSNLLSVVPIVPLALLSGEFPAVLHALSVRAWGFKMAYLASGFLTTAVCASAFWTIALTSGSTLSFIGGFNKVPIILLSLVMFDMHVSVAGWIGVSLGVLAGVVFVRAKAGGEGEWEGDQENKVAEKLKVLVDAEGGDDRREGAIAAGGGAVAGGMGQVAGGGWRMAGGG